MTVTNKFEMDLVTRGVTPRVSAVQNDANTRALEITLTAEGKAWQVPAGITAAVAYRKPDGTRGFYDTLPDGSSAVSVNGNVVTAILAPQALTVAGEISAAVILNDKNLTQLATFPFVIEAAPNPAAGAASDHYYAYSTMEDVSDAVEAWLTETEAEKKAFLSETEAAKEAFLTEAEDALSTIRQIVTEAEDAPAIVCQASGEMICIDDASDRLVRGLTLYGKTTQDGTPTIDSPVELESVGSGGSIGVRITGKNLIPYPYSNKTKTTNGITFTDNGDGSITINGTATANAYFDLIYQGIYLGGVYTATDATGKGYRNNYAYSLINGTANIRLVYQSNGTVFIQVSSGTAAENITVYPQIEYGTVVTEYEPPRGQKITLSTPNGLPGIPVSSGGNYTDSSGQAWICDEIDLAKGVYIRRIGVVESYTDEKITEPFLSTVGELAEGAKILYILPGSVETPLDVQILAAYAALHTNKPNTTVYNDTRANMALSYVADTKTYVDHKFTALQNAILAAGANI